MPTFGHTKLETNRYPYSEMCALCHEICGIRQYRPCFFVAARLFIGQWDSATNPTHGSAKWWIPQHRSLGLIYWYIWQKPCGFFASKNCWFQWRFQICFSIVTNQTPKRMYTVYSYVGVWYINILCMNISNFSLTFSHFDLVKTSMMIFFRVLQLRCWAIPTKGHFWPFFFVHTVELLQLCWLSGSIGSHVMNGIVTYTFTKKQIISLSCR